MSISSRLLGTGLTSNLLLPTWISISTPMD